MTTFKAIEITDDNCPSNEFEAGEASGKCWGDGHYRCKLCKHFRQDFKERGQAFIDFAHNLQSFQVHTL